MKKDKLKINPGVDKNVQKPRYPTKCISRLEKVASVITVTSMVGGMLSACSETTVSAPSLNPTSPQNGEVFEPDEPLTTVGPVNATENTPTLESTLPPTETLAPVICDVSLESRISQLSTPEGMANYQMPVVISEAGLASIPFESAEVAEKERAGYVSRVTATVLQIAGASLQISEDTSIGRVLVPQFVNLEQAMSDVEDALGTALPFELAHQEADKSVGENELSVNTLVGQRSAVMIFGPGSRVAQRGETNIMQGDVMQIIYNDDTGKNEVVYLPPSGLGGAHEVFAIDGCPVDVATVSMGGVVGVYNEINNTWSRTSEVAVSTEEWPYKQEFVSSAGVNFTIDSLPEGVPEGFIGFVESPETDRILNRILYIIQTGDIDTTDEQAIRDYFSQPGTVDFLYAKKDPSEPDKPYRITVEREEIERNRVRLNLLTTEEASHYTMVSLNSNFDVGGFSFDFTDTDNNGKNELVVNVFIPLDTDDGIVDYIYNTDAGSCNEGSLTWRLQNGLTTSTLVQTGVLHYNDNSGIPAGPWWEFAVGYSSDIGEQLGPRNNKIFSQKPCLTTNN